MPTKHPSPAPATEAVEVATDIAARPETIFRYFTDPERFARWLSAPVALEPRPEGRLRIDFAQHGTVVEGRIREIVEGERIVFTWGVAEGPQAEKIPAGATTVTIALTPVGDKTRVTIRHEGLPDADERRDHAGGWTHYLAQLDRRVVEDERFDGFDAVIGDFFAAWAETDGARRDALLARCFAEDGEFADAFGHAVGRAALSRHIAGAQHAMPGAKMEIAGEAKPCLRFAAVPWKASGADGQPLGAGVDYCEIGPDGRLARVVGFWG